MVVDRASGLVMRSSVAGAVAAVLVAVHSVEGVVEVVVGVQVGDVHVHAAGPDVTLVAHLGAAEPGRGCPLTDRT
jgi:hypothetical protein